MLQRIMLSVIAAIVVLAVATAGWLFLFADDSNSSATLDIQIGKVRLAVPGSYIRSVDNRRSGEFSEIDIAASAKDFRPVLQPEKLRQGMEDGSEGILYLTIREQEKSIDPADRPARLYVRFLEQEEWTHPGGLVMRRFESGSPFGREDLYMAPPEGRLFAARCIRPQQPPDGLPNTCLSEFRIRGLDIRMRFSPAQLGDWERIVAGVQGLVLSIAR